MAVRGDSPNNCPLVAIHKARFAMAMTRHEKALKAERPSFDQFFLGHGPASTREAYPCLALGRDNPVVSFLLGDIQASQVPQIT